MPFAEQPAESISAYHILPVLLPSHVDRVAVIASLKGKGIQSSIHYPPFWSFTAYADQFSPTQAPVLAEICDRQLTLPLFPTMTPAEVDKVTNVLLKAIK